MVNVTSLLLRNVDINECIDSDCEQMCNNTVGSYTCSCNNGYSLNSDGRNCSGMVTTSILTLCTAFK